MGFLEGKKGLIYGVRNQRSIAWGCAQSLAREGAELALTFLGEREEQDVKKLAPELGDSVKLAQQHEIISLTVTDAQALAACNHFVDTTRVLVEPACGAAIAALDVHRETLSRFKAPLLEVCGGTGVTLARLYAWSLELDLS